MNKCITTWLQQALQASLTKGLVPKDKLVLFPLLFAFLLMSVSVQAQEGITVNGKVQDESGFGLPGVKVMLKGTTTAVPTDLDGNFSITIPDGNSTLVLSYIGFQTQEVPVNNRSTIAVVLAPDSKTLGEVVVVGYGTQRRQDITGAVTAISEEDFVQGQITTPEQLISGKVAGVQITSNGGAPGAGSRIRIRGGASLNASNDPLIVIDGVPLENSAVSGTANPLSFLNPNDIETFNILKDASATAIYGSRASNGVIIITTKKGQLGQKLKLNFSTMHTLSVVGDKVDVLSADEFRAVVNERGTEAQKALLGDASTDWQDLIFRKAYTTDNNVGFSGSIKGIELPYRVSLGYLNQQGVLLRDNFQRGSATLNLNPSFLDDHLRVNLNLKGAQTKSHFADHGAIGAAVAFDPTKPAYADNRFGGYYQWTEPSGNFNTLATRNPLSMLNQRDDEGEVKRAIGNLQLDYRFHFLPDLRANLNLGFDRTKGEGFTRYAADFAPNAFEGGRLSRYSQEKENDLVDFYLNYVKDITAISSRVDVTAGYSYQEFSINEPSFPIVNLVDTVLAAAGNPSLPYFRLKSFFGRVNYSLMDRYIFTATVRRDGSSRFSPENRWGTFPALALAWRISEEPFLRESKTISDLKLRLGYGVTGQQDIGERNVFPYLPNYTPSDNRASYQLGNQWYNTLRPEGYDTGIKWEETVTYNAGLDYGFMDGRLNGTLDYYHKKTKDLLAQVAVPAGTNLTNELITNVGNIETKGLEAALNYTAISTEKLTWDIGINGTYNKIEITNLSRVEDPDFVGYFVGGIAGGVGNNIQIHSVGYAPFSFYVYKQVYDAAGKPLEGIYADLNGDGVISESDKYRYKAPNPTAFFGFNSQLTYGNFNFSFVMRGNVGNYLYNNVYSNNGAYRAFSFSNYLTNVSRNVQETQFQDFQLFSDYYMENASFLRMENISFGYNFGRILNDKAGLRLTANIQNAFVITKYRGLDPEIPSGIDNNFYPRPRVFALGLNFEL
ncbi:SusC/RagA family TonB-linked outer membrane protein [Pontibacter beigongshangensis]|uniref:SusC/RagA family TonB-linked outer membrane protein n=1 Tax=Pontibacter beigongshangensis TaxID=2574733 RepID=UPI001650413A|nr:TonB-dependent receptor [Pontibacter beigongshangensis]